MDFIQESQQEEGSEFNFEATTSETEVQKLLAFLVVPQQSTDS